MTVLLYQHFHVALKLLAFHHLKLAHQLGLLLLAIGHASRLVVHPDRLDYLALPDMDGTCFMQLWLSWSEVLLLVLLEEQV